jgi:hypothetical protein
LLGASEKSTKSIAARTVPVDPTVCSGSVGPSSNHVVPDGGMHSLE